MGRLKGTKRIIRSGQTWPKEETLLKTFGKKFSRFAKTGQTRFGDDDAKKLIYHATKAKRLMQRIAVSKALDAIGLRRTVLQEKKARDEIHRLSQQVANLEIEEVLNPKIDNSGKAYKNIDKMLSLIAENAGKKASGRFFDVFNAQYNRLENAGTKIFRKNLPQKNNKKI